MIEDENFHSRVICDLFFNPKNMRYAKVAWKRLESNIDMKGVVLEEVKWQEHFQHTWPWIYSFLVSGCMNMSTWLQIAMSPSMKTSFAFPTSIQNCRVICFNVGLWKPLPVEGEIGNCHMTYDSGLACIFIQGSCSYARDCNVITTNLYYVGVLKEILVVSYATMKHILFCASWIPSNLCGAQTI